MKDKVEKELLKEQLACKKRSTNKENKLNCKCLKYKCFPIIERYKLKEFMFKEKIINISNNDKIRLQSK